MTSTSAEEKQTAIQVNIEKPSFLSIYIRHGQKLYSNGNPIQKKNCTDSFPIFDPPLLAGEEEKASKLGQHLVNEYGVPDVIITSPFLRCQQTANGLNKEVKAKVECSYDIGEYLGNWPMSPKNKQHYKIKNKIWFDKKIDPSKVIIEPYHDYSALVKRVSKHLNQRKKRKEKVIWYVTHGLILKEVCQQVKKEKKEFNCLDYIVV